MYGEITPYAFSVVTLMVYEIPGGLMSIRVAMAVVIVVFLILQ